MPSNEWFEDYVQAKLSSKMENKGDGTKVNRITLRNYLQRSRSEMRIKPMFCSHLQLEVGKTPVEGRQEHC